MSPPHDKALAVITPTVQREKSVVLHVDDDAASLIMAEGALEDAGFEVVQASDGLEAIDQFKEHEPDLIIMDAVMPNMDGFDAIAHIRKLSLGAHTPILMVTGLDDLDSITRAYDEGATDFLTKPVNFFLLPYRMQYMLRSKLTADALRSSQAKLDNAQRIARLGHWEWHAATGLMMWSSESGRIMGYAEGELSGEWDNFLQRIAGDERDAVKIAAEQAVASASGFGIEFTRISMAEGDKRSVRIEAEPHINENGECSHLIGTLQDITERTDAQKQIHDLAYFDLVTGLPNRAQLNEQLNYVLSLAERNGNKFALLFLDLDHFKQVNDTLGHDAGDDLLRQVSHRLTEVVRESDTVSRSADSIDEEPGAWHTVARLGGDEFVVLLGQINRAEDAARVAERIASSVSESYAIGDNEVNVTTTIGIAVYPADGENSEILMKHADVAMYHAKEQGRNGYQFYSRGIHEQALARFSMEAELKTAIENEQLGLLFQPKVCMQSGCVKGLEALVRWNHPERGEINPTEFIPLAEETGLILPLGHWVLDAACVQMQRWIKAGMEPLAVAINCSPVQFERGDMVADVSDAIKRSGLDPSLIEIELTERLFLRDIDAGIASLSRLKELGIIVSIDDFGTGFSSLSYLKRLPVDKLKIDQSFVTDLETDAGDAAIVTAIITLAHNLQMEVIAEGVETREQFNMLQSYGCDEAQGFLISYPVPAEELEEWLLARDRQTTLGKVSGL